MGVDPAQFASLDASRHSAQLRDILALRSSSLRQYLLDIVAPWSSKAQAAPAFIDGRAELYGEKFVIDYSTRSRRC